MRLFKLSINKKTSLPLWVMATLFALLLLTISAKAQAPDTLWTKTYGGISHDEGKSVQQTTDGGYIIAGYSSSFGAGGGDVYLIKTDQNGDTLWTKTYGGSSADYGQFVRQTTDGGYIVVGGTYSFGVGDGDVYLIKTDDYGDTLWTKTFGGLHWDYGYSVQEISDGGYILVGETNSFGDGSSEIYLIKTNTAGDSLWTKTYTSPKWVSGYSVRETNDGAYIIVGGESGYGDIYLIKVSTDGDMLWTKIYGGAYGDVGYCVQQTSDNGYIIAGSSSSYSSGDYDIYLLKTDINGDSLWAKTFIHNYSGDAGYSVQQTFSGGYLIAGCTGSNAILIKTDDIGNSIWTKTISGEFNRAYFAQQCSDGGYIVTGFADTSGLGKADVYLIRIASDVTGIVEKDEIRPLRYNLNQNYPNPFNPETVISYRLPESASVELIIYNTLGQRIKTLVNKKQNAGKYRVKFDGSGLASGVYFYRLQVSTISTKTYLFNNARKMILLR